MIKIAQLPIALLLLQLSACGAADQTGNDPTHSASSELGGDACKNTEITVKNSFYYDAREREITVDYVQYYSADEGDWYTQALGDETIAYGHQHTWNNKDLQHAEGDLLTKWRVYFRYRESDGDNSDKVYEEINTPDHHCWADDNFTLTVN